MSLVGFVICVVAAADAKQRLGEFASREVPEHEIKVAREMHYLGIDWPPNGFVCMELIRAVAWAVSICLLILEYETHSTIETLLYVLFERGVRAREFQSFHTAMFQLRRKNIMCIAHSYRKKISRNNQRLNTNSIVT